MQPSRAGVRVRLLASLAVLVLAGACTGSGDDGSSQAGGSADEQPTVAALDELLDQMPVPEVVDPDAELRCERLGSTCDLTTASREQLELGVEVSRELATAMADQDGPVAQLRTGLELLRARDDLSYVLTSDELATSVTFVLDGGPEFTVLTDAGELQGTLSTPAGAAEPSHDTTVTLASASAGGPPSYHPAGGPRSPRRALLLDPFAATEGWPVAEVAAIFAGHEDYTEVVHLRDEQVDPFALSSIGSYDAVHIMSHGGGSCPSWTDDRSQCASTFVGGPIDEPAFYAELAAGDAEVRIAGISAVTAASDPDTLRWSFDDQALRGIAGLDDTIVYFAVCGSDFGFSTIGAGSTVAWTGTSRVDVVVPVAARFWELMVTDGVDFELARDLVKDSGIDQHNGIESLNPGVNFFTEAVFSGSNLRARDVVEVRIDGEEPDGQVVQFDGRPEDGDEEAVPAADQEVTIRLEGVASGTEGGVTFEVRADGDVVDSDIQLPRDGVVVEEGDGYASWDVTVRPGAIQWPDVPTRRWSPRRPRSSSRSEPTPGSRTATPPTVVRSGSAPTSRSPDRCRSSSSSRRSSPRER